MKFEILCFISSMCNDQILSVPKSPVIYFTYF